MRRNLKHLPLKRTHIKSHFLLPFVEQNLSSTLKMISTKLCLLHKRPSHDIIHIINKLLRIFLNLYIIKPWGFILVKSLILVFVVITFGSLSSWVMMTWTDSCKIARDIIFCHLFSQRVERNFKSFLIYIFIHIPPNVMHFLHTWIRIYSTWLMRHCRIFLYFVL